MRTRHIFIRISLAIAAVLAASTASAAAIAINIATGGTATWFPAAQSSPLGWIAGLTLATAGATVLVWWSQRAYDKTLAELVPPARRPPTWVIDRPDEVRSIVRALCGRKTSGVAGLTAAIHGAGGFGKTTLAKLTGADSRVLRRFGNRIYWVTLGRDIRRGALAEHINDLIRQIDPSNAQQITDTRQAAQHLAKILAAGPRRLIIVDDVWFDDQLEAFPIAGKCARLVTTRNPSLLGTAGSSIQVDQMSPKQAAALLTTDLPVLGSLEVNALLHETGRWPLLLRLINKILLDRMRLHTDVNEQAKDLLRQLRKAGKLHVDVLTGAVNQKLDVNDPDQRDKALAATIEASVGLLEQTDRTRFLELAIFAEDEIVPVSLVATLWRNKAVSPSESERICVRLADLALLSLSATEEGGTIELHDVVRDYLRDQLGDSHLARLNRELIAAIGDYLPHSTADLGRGIRNTWWSLPASPQYLWEHLVEHLLDAGFSDEATAVATDPRWAAARLVNSSVAAIYSDLALIETPLGAKLGRSLGQAAHLLAPTDPTYSCVDILLSRIAQDAEWGPGVAALTATRECPRLVNDWPLPDMPEPALRLTLVGHSKAVRKVVAGPNGAWLATAAVDGEVRIWDSVTGRQRLNIVAHKSEVIALNILQNGRWIASASRRNIRIWDAETGQLIRSVRSNRKVVRQIAMTADHKNLVAITGGDQLIVWRLGSKRVRSAVMRHLKVHGFAISAHGNKLAFWQTEDRSGVVRVRRVCLDDEHAFDALKEKIEVPDGGTHGPIIKFELSGNGDWASIVSGHETIRVLHLGQEQHNGHTIRLPEGTRPKAVAVSADGHTTAVLNSSGVVTVQRTDSQSHLESSLSRGKGVAAFAMPPSGTWLATASEEVVRIWDTETSASFRPSPESTVYPQPVRSIAVSPSGRWFASVGIDREIRIRDAQTGVTERVLHGHAGEGKAVAIAPNGRWLAVTADDNSIRIWNPTDSRPQHVFRGHSLPLTAVAIARSGDWLASTSEDGTVRTWDAEAMTPKRTLFECSRSINLLAISSDSRWIAVDTSYSAISILDSQTGEEKVKFEEFGGPPKAVALSCDDTWMAVATTQGATYIFDIASKKCLAKLGSHLNAVRTVRVDPNDRWLATVDEFSIIVWDIKTWKPIASMRVDQSIFCCAWSNDGTSLIVGGDAGFYRYRLLLAPSV